MRILVSGAGGLVGGELTGTLAEAGHEVVALVRRSPRNERELPWDPLGSELPGPTREALGGFGAVIHLAGEPIAALRWTARRKRAIEESRVRGTALLARSLAALDGRPDAFLVASAVGIYGDRGATWVDHEALPGSGFLARVCRRWEAAADPAREAGIRVAHLRFGAILHAKGGMLGPMKLPFRLGLGGPIGSGRQFVSWIAADDVVGATLHVLAHPELEGPIDVVAPHPVTMLEFTTALAGVYRRKARIKLPKAAARLLFGELAEELFLAGQRVRPTELLRSGYAFRHPELVRALRAILDRPKTDWFEELEDPSRVCSQPDP